MNETQIIESIIFFGFAGLTLLFALLSIAAKNILYSLLFAVIAFFFAGGVFFSLNADYNAVAQISIYGVAIPVLFLFAIMFTSENEKKEINLSFSPRFFIGIISSTVLFMVIWYSIEFALHFNSSLAKFFNPAALQIGDYDSILSVAKNFYYDNGAGLVLFSILLLTVVIGISVLNVIKEKRRG